MRRHSTLAVGMLLAAAALPASAGIADSPLPILTPGATSYHLYSVPGVTHSGGLDTVFACTSTDTAPMQVGVEIFGNVAARRSTMQPRPHSPSAPARV